MKQGDGTLLWVGFPRQCRLWRNRPVFGWRKAALKYYEVFGCEL
jgi:hypothetical protein